MTWTSSWRSTRGVPADGFANSCTSYAEPPKTSFKSWRSIFPVACDFYLGMPSALCASRTAKIMVSSRDEIFQEGAQGFEPHVKSTNTFGPMQLVAGRETRSSGVRFTSIGSCSQPVWKRGARWDEEQPEDRRNRQVHPDRPVDTWAGTLQKAAALDHRLGPSIHFSSMLRPAFVSARCFAACDRRQRRCSRQARTTSTVLQESAQKH
jgi:hypothetical protein